ncbi:MAG: endopeptidase La [Firmicutes bacterium]|nr:endopeptidase La [Bacillota bacterium]MBQ7242085.1 endopeptidase La [Bacillota bacterium]
MYKEINKMPMIPLRGMVVFPNMVASLSIGRQKSLNSLEDAMTKDEMVFFVTQMDSQVETPSDKDLFKMGTVGKVKQVLKLPGNVTHVITEGITRARLTKVYDMGTKFFADGVEVPQDYGGFVSPEDRALMKLGFELHEKYLALGTHVPGSEPVVNVLSTSLPGQLADIICSSLSLPYGQKQDLLETEDPTERLRKVVDILYYEIQILDIKKEIEEKVKERIDKTQKEYYLREKIKTIREELGDVEDAKDEASEFLMKIGKLNLKKESYDHLAREVHRYSNMSPSSPDASVIRSYIEYIISLPWTEATDDNLDLKKAEEILDRDHYGMKDVKERMLEFLAVRQTVKLNNAPIVCLVGPPGVGKTSIARSIAEALGRRYVRMSLGGIKDESEIRGHRKTYIGAMAGRIIDAMKQAGTINPLILLDEVDKLSTSYHGDPASALLEVLDGEQNSTFRDHYVEIPYDLSHVLFICTANFAENIPGPLYDRMEIINLSSYTTEEKFMIAKNHLYSKQLKLHGLNKTKLKISDDAIREIISSYTREAGVRQLERYIGKLCRKAVKIIFDGQRKSVSVTPKNLEDYLGRKKFMYDKIYDKPQIGIVRGLAWTSAGGDTLSVEVNTMKGKGKLVLTGNLGDVMKESAQAAMSYIRSVSDKLKVDEDFYKEKDVHIHIPEGAVPKDGPSAGITMASAMISALTNVNMRNDVAMTGEITLRGRVLPIGGLKEKVLAAKRAGIVKVIIPFENERDMEDIPDNVKEGMDFVFVKEMSEVLENVTAKGESVWR